MGYLNDAKEEVIELLSERLLSTDEEEIKELAGEITDMILESYKNGIKAGYAKSAERGNKREEGEKPRRESRRSKRA